MEAEGESVPERKAVGQQAGGGREGDGYSSLWTCDAYLAQVSQWLWVKLGALCSHSGSSKLLQPKHQLVETQHEAKRKD